MNSVHIKLQFENEIRRFSCEPVLSVLEQFVRTLLDINFSFVLKYPDEDNDLCNISNQFELDYAVSHITSPLRIKVIKQLNTQPLSQTVAQTNTLPAPVSPMVCLPREQVLQNKLLGIKALLERPDLPPQRAENLKKRQQNLEAKLEQFKSASQTPSDAPEWRGHGGCRRGRGARGPHSAFGCHSGAFGHPHGGRHAFDGAPDAVPSGDCSASPFGGSYPGCHPGAFGHPRGAFGHAHGGFGHGPHHGRGRRNGHPKCNKESSPEVEKLHQEIFALREVVQAKKTALQDARKNGVEKPELESLFEELITAKNNLRAKKVAKRELKDARLCTPLDGENVPCSFRERRHPNRCNQEGPKSRQQTPEFSQMKQEIFALKELVAVKRMALQDARKNGASKPEIEILFQDLIVARNNLIAKKTAKRQFRLAEVKKDVGLDEAAPMPQCPRKLLKQNPQIAEMKQEVFALKDVMKAKKAALQEARKNGATKPEIEKLFAEFVVARNNLQQKRFCLRELKDAQDL